MHCKKIFLIGIFLGTLFFFFSTPTFGETNILCSYKGPDISADSLELTRLIVEGPYPTKDGDLVTIRFDLRNVGRAEIELGKKGVYVAGIDPDQEDISFGFTYGGKVLKGGETVSIEASKRLDKTGTWKFWPSYHLSFDDSVLTHRTGERYGPDEWHVCSVAVERVIIEEREEEPTKSTETDEEEMTEPDEIDEERIQEEENELEEFFDVEDEKETNEKEGDVNSEDEEQEDVESESNNLPVTFDPVYPDTVIEQQGLTVEDLTCIHSVSGEISSFPYDYETLKIKVCSDPVSVSGDSSGLRDIKTCPSEDSIKYFDVSQKSVNLNQIGRSHTYQIGGLCPDTTYLIQPVYSSMEGKCEWKGGFEPKALTVSVKNSALSVKEFIFKPVETEKPQVTMSYNSSVQRENGVISNEDNITISVTGSDSDGIARIQIFQRLGYKTEDDTINYEDEELVDQCVLSNGPTSEHCSYMGGPYLGADVVDLRTVVCDVNGNSSSEREDVLLTKAHCFNGLRDSDEQGIDCGGSCRELCPPTCDDGIQNRDEEGIDCGGSWCPPCSNCDSGTRWSPEDSPCKNHWPTDEGPQIGMNTKDNSCSLIEVCHPELDYIVEDAITCCENSDFETLFSGDRSEEKKVACQYARGTSGIDMDYNQTSFKRCLGVYPVSGLGGAGAYMQGYFSGELCCGGSTHCPSECSKWDVNPAVWEMGTAMSCAGAEGVTPDFQMTGHRCVYNENGLCSVHCWRSGEMGYWKSDTDYTKNNDSFADVPAHASINLLSTGTCVDYSFALTTILRKLGYNKDDALSVSGDKHAYNLVRFPGVMKWSYVDTVGNRAGEIFGGIGYSSVYDSGVLTASYDYCKKMKKGCSNDYYSQKKGNCPSNELIFSCEGVPR